MGYPATAVDGLRRQPPLTRRACGVFVLLAGCYDIRLTRDAATDASDVIDASDVALVDVPDVTTPDVPDVPAVDVPDVLAVDVPDVLAVDVPDVLAVDIPDVPDAPAVDGCAGACAGAPPRPLAPLSTTTVTSARPTLRWVLPAGVTRVRLDLCRDRACSTTVTTSDVTASNWQPTTPLDAGAWFWRLRSMDGAAVSATASPVWEFFVGASRLTSVDSSAGSTLDLNGDGLADVVVGAPTRNLEGPGAVQVFYGVRSGITAIPSATLAPPAGVLGFGQNVASAGDVNGDGYADLLVTYNCAAPFTANRFSGGVYLFLGGRSGVAMEPTSHLPTIAGVDSAFGMGAGGTGTAGDVDHDGYGDVVVGARGSNSAVGHAYVYRGSATGLVTTAAAYDFAPAPASHQFGVVALSADFNGDDRVDLAVMAGSINGTAGSGDQGRAYVYLGTATGLPSAASVVIFGPGTYPGGERFGWSATAGDVNGDGHADLMVGSPYANGEGATANSGRVYLYLGGPSGTGLHTGVADASMNNPAVNSRYGAVLSSRDLDGDGYADLAVGTMDVQQTVRIYRGRAAGLDPTSIATINAPVSDEFFGSVLHLSGDTDGDGASELVVGSFGVGLAYVYRGWRATVPTTFSPSATFTGGPTSGLGSDCH